MGTGGSQSGSSSVAASNDVSATHVRRHPGKKTDGRNDAASDDEVAVPETKGDVRRQQSAAERALSGFASALGGGGPNSPSHAGLPRIPGIPLLPGGIP